jgi:hypothetical protein
LGWSADTLVGYYKRNGLASSALDEFDRLLADPKLPQGAIHNFFGFLQHTDYVSRSTTDSLNRIVRSEHAPLHVRTAALQLIFDRGITSKDLEDLSKSTNKNLSILVFNLLVERQHRPTIERGLAALRKDDAGLKAANDRFPDSSPISWIGKVRSPEIWPSLASLRAQALKLSLQRVVTLIEGTLARMNKAALADLIRGQIQFAPSEWREWELLKAMAYERDARLEAAQKIPFDIVVRKLIGSSTMRRFKVWCEGPNDVPAFQTLLSKLRISRRIDMEMVAQDLGGWANAVSPSRDLSRLWDGCFDLLVVLDGDVGRQMLVAGCPLSKEGTDLQLRLHGVGIDLWILERYAIENYFSQSALEAVTGKNLGSYFPLPKNRPIKALNGTIVERMELTDFVGTDLIRILDEISRRTALS